MNRRLFVAGEIGARRLALCDNSRLIEYLVEDRASRIEDIVRGKVLAVDHSLGAVFIEVGATKPGLLPLAELKQTPSAGADLMVQIKRDGAADKGPRLTSRVRLRGRCVDLLPGQAGVMPAHGGLSPTEIERVKGTIVDRLGGSFAVALRAPSLIASTEALTAEIDRLARAWEKASMRAAGGGSPILLCRGDDVLVRMLRDVGEHDVIEIAVDQRALATDAARAIEERLPELAARVIHRPARDWHPSLEEIDEQIEEALDEVVPLPGGGFLRFELGRTLTAVDVNSGGGDGGGRSRDSQSPLAVNLAATAETARQLRLRNIGGIVVIDFVDLVRPQDRRRVIVALREALHGDAALCWVGEMSRLGLVEMTRQRRGRSLLEALTRPCDSCGGSGRRPRLGTDRA